MGTGERHLNTTTRIHRLLTYIDANLDGDLGLEQLSRVAHLSKYHLHRCFSASQGIPLARYISQSRLRRAAWQLAFRPALPVTEISLGAGYGSLEAFSRAFRRFTGCSPRAFREQPEWDSWQAEGPAESNREKSPMHTGNITAAVEIVEFPELPVARLDHQGPPGNLGQTLGKFIQWRRENRLPPSISRTFNLIFDDPLTADPAGFRFGLCAATSKPVAPNEFGIFNDTIPGGRCARLCHTGSDAGLEPLVRHLYGDWLAASGERVRDFPLFFERVSFFPDVPQSQAVTYIFLPLG